MNKYFINLFIVIVLFLLTTNVYSAGFLQFPATGYTKSTAPVSAVMDHDLRFNYIKTFKGETGSYYDGCLAYVGSANVACDPAKNASAPWAYKRPGGLSWSVAGIKYIDNAPGSNVFMWYDNHRGYDFVIPEMTQVVASANGTLGKITTSYGQVTVDHGNGYRTTYTHMRLNLPLPTRITKGSILGWVSDVSPSPISPHLHFVVERNNGGKWYVVDPYGGSGEPVLWE
jgi:murein DD-endopeptidase MepM/ murein hydrolase activator NlpD